MTVMNPTTLPNRIHNIDTMVIVPEIGVPYDPGAKYIDLRERAMAACATADELKLYGLKLDAPTPEDRDTAAALVASYAQNPEETSKQVSSNRQEKMTTASMILAGEILDEFGRQVVYDSLQLRHMVTNKLVIESENPDARVRLRALELLGKISDVGLFTEKKEVTVNHTSTEELRATLKSKLARMLPGSEDASDAEYEVIGDDVGDSDTAT